jgi:hypothetical protein
MKQLLFILALSVICIPLIGQRSEAYILTSSSENNARSNNDHWVVNQVNGKSNNGKLVVDLAKDTEWDIIIYAAGSDKPISRTMLQTAFSLAPGLYDIEVNKIRVEGIPVEKGNVTRIKAGTLTVTRKTLWTLYDAEKKYALINSISPEKRGLPAGKYIITINGEDREVIIKDGEVTVI